MCFNLSCHLFSYMLSGVFISAVRCLCQSYHVFLFQLSSVFIHDIWCVYLSCDMSVSKLSCVSISAVMCFYPSCPLFQLPAVLCPLQLGSGSLSLPAPTLPRTQDTQPTTIHQTQHCTHKTINYYQLQDSLPTTTISPSQQSGLILVARHPKITRI